MYTIYMNSDRTLIQSNIIKLYQREKLANKLGFIIPKKYEDYDLIDFIIILNYVDVNNVAHSEVLSITDENYEEKYLLFSLPIDTELTRYAGDIIISLSLTKYDMDLGKQVSIPTDSTTIKINPVANIYEFIPDESLDSVTQMIGALDSRIKALDLLGESYSTSQAKDLTVDSETDKLYLVNSDGEKIGEGVEILVAEEEADGENDGILDVNSINVSDDVLEI